MNIIFFWLFQWLDKKNSLQLQGIISIRKQTVEILYNCRWNLILCSRTPDPLVKVNSTKVWPCQSCTGKSYWVSALYTQFDRVIQYKLGLYRLTRLGHSNVLGCQCVGNPVCYHLRLILSLISFLIRIHCVLDFFIYTSNFCCCVVIHK